MKRSYLKASLWTLLLVSSLRLNTSVFGQTTSLVTVDKVHGYVGLLGGPTVFSSGVGSQTGKPADYGIDFGTGGAATSVHITNATFLNIAATNDILTFSFWLKRYDIANSSVFWANSRSSGGDERGFQAHAPWSDDTIFFDTAGTPANCCDTSMSRISENISTFPPYQLVNDDSWWTNWHHFVFFKNGPDKQIWIDGQQFLDGNSSNPLPTDFSDLFLGADGAGANNVHGEMDDFAIFSTAISPNNINKLYTGTSPTALTGETLMAYWDFDDPPVIMPPIGSFDRFSILVNDVGKSVMNTNTIALSLNGTNVTPATVTKAASTTTIAYLLPNPPFPPGSTQYTAISIEDQTGKVFTNASFFVAPQLLLPPGLALAAASVDKTKPGFKIRSYQVDDTSTGNGIDFAEDILAGKYGPNVANLADAGGADNKGYFTWTNVINFDIDPTMQNGSFNDPTYTDFNFPGIPGNPATALPTEHFACELFTALEFPTAGAYTMVVNSDDDFRTVAGLNPLDIFTALRLGEFADPGGRGSADTVFKFFVQQAGIYGFRTVFEQGGGGANLEWFMINPDGTRVLINDVTNSIKSYQWLPSITAAYVKSVVPQIGATSADPDLVQAVIGDGSNPILANQVSLQVDDTVVAAQVIKTGAETTVTYTPSRLFAPASRHTATLLFQDGPNPVSRAWQFTVGAYTQDKVRSYVGTLQGNATYTADAGGHGGKPSDYAIDFGRVGDGSVYIKRAGQFLNVASTNDEMSFSLWIKRYDIADSSTFWANAPSVGGSRGWQAHTPWSDDTIYFDTAGCCDTSAQRVSDTITNFPGYTGNDGFWTNWHHFVLSKKLDDKQIWIDGKLFLDGSNSDPLPSDFTDMYLGSYGTGAGGFMHGWIDDFAVFATALGANDITMLFSGAAPTALATSTKLLAYWDFNDAPVPVVSIPSIGIALVSGKPTITYTGTLQSSLTVNGTFTDVTGATNPYTPTATGPQTFYRARQ